MKGRAKRKVLLLAGPWVIGFGAVAMFAAIFGGAPAVSAADVPDGPEATAIHAYRAGFRDRGLVLAIMVAGAESNYNAAAVGQNPPTRGCPNGSRDRGVWQINDCYHAEVSDACAHDTACAAVEVYRISSGGAVWTPWTTYNQGKHLPYEPVAIAAAALAPSAAQATIVGANALPLPRDRLNEAIVTHRHWDGRMAWDGPVPLGTPVFAIEAGTVVTVTSSGNCGIGVIVAAAGHRDLYCHGSRVLVAAGNAVVAGQQIMVSGSTGERVTGPHLHLEVQVEGRNVCPQHMLLAWYRNVPFSPLRAGTSC